MKVLVLSTSNDAHASAIGEACALKGASTQLVLVDELVDSDWITLLNERGEWSCTSPVPDAVIYRRLGAVRSPGTWGALPDRVRRFAAYESEAALVALYEITIQQESHWINDYYSTIRADNKVRQMMAASKVGLRSPETLFSTNVDEMAAFTDRHSGDVIAKACSLPLVSEERDLKRFLYATPVDLRGLHKNQIRGVPLFAQERIYGRELRVTVVGERVFPAEIMSGRNEVDWRRGLGDYTSFKAVDIDEGLKESLTSVVRDLGLVYGAADVIISNDGEPVFLEVNPVGAYLWLERELGFEISSAIADEVTR